MNRSVIITGATGFVGSNLVPYLSAKGYHVYKASRKPDTRFPEWISYEHITSAFIKENKVYAIIHLAGKAHDLKNTTEENEYFAVNTVLTQKIFDVFTASEASVFFYMSSVKASADSVAGTLEEDVLPKPETAYGKSKLAAEQYLLSKDIGPKQLYIFRPCMIHGPGNKGNLNLLFKLVQKNFPWPLAAYKNNRSFLFVENLCFSIHTFLQHGSIPSGIYNVADSGTLSTSELIKILASVSGKKPLLLKIPKAIINGLAAIGSVLHLPLNKERLGKLTENYVVSNQKILKAMGKPLPRSLEEGMEITSRSFQKQ